MRLIKFLKRISMAAIDPERDLYERVFISLTLMSEFVAVCALIGDFAVGENIGEIVAIIATVISVPVLTYVCVKKHKIKLAVRLIVAGLSFVLLPMLFFHGGGVEGGGVIWFIFAFLYTGLLMTGGLRIFVLTYLVILAGACYMIEYYHPELIHGHTREAFFFDSYLSLVLVGVLCFAMSWFQNRLFNDESKRAKKEAERAEELTRAQNRFFSSMSHEIRTPINSILGLNELILRDPSASAEIINDAGGIQGAGKMLLALINDILDFSKMEAGSMDIVPVDYKIGDMISDIVNMIWLRATDKGLDFRVSVDPNLPSVLYGDEVRIKQIIVNLLNNAVKYTASGTVELHVESETMEDDYVLLNISVSDTGMGIKKEALPFLFDAFKRVDEEKNRHIEGTGLGLNIVKQLTELMGGTISVNSVYGEGSVFTVALKQGISNHKEVGELNIHNQKDAKREAYEAGFKAPDAAILIVDDNEMNLEVEARLLADTEMVIDKAVNGREALDMALKRHYDAILMDHLMPEMNGIECLRALREQSGGMNRQTPVIVLTANAGSENRELYNRSGFDGYLVKPVSGESLENTLIKYISSDKLVLSSRVMSMGEDINTMSGYSGKQSVIITTSSVSDVPDSIIRKQNLHIIPARIKTEEGVFKDGVQMSADELVRYIESGRNAVSSAADEAAYTEFFARNIKRAHHVIHIALTTSMSQDYKMASEAAKAFENVTVINSGTLSSATALLVLIALRLAQQNVPVEDIVSEIEAVKGRLRCSFVVDTTDYMAKKGHISPRVHKIAKGLNLHPFLTFKDDISSIGGVAVGKTRWAYKKYIRRAFPVDIIPDSEVAFITYVDIPMDTLLWIKEELSKIAYFEHIVFQQASAAISSNCGPGTFGILYFVKGNKTYNIGSLIEEEDDEEGEDDNYGDTIGYHTSVMARSAMPGEHEDESENDHVSGAVSHGAGAPVMRPEYAMENSEPKWYEGLENIDGETAIKNSGSEDAFKTVLKIFYESVPAKYAEIEGFYSAEDWNNYTIKVHALKSSAKLIGAMDLSEKAQKLETAGKENDTAYIRSNHEDMMKDYLKFKTILAPVFGDTEEKSAGKPVADESLMKSVYDGIREAADAMDCDTLEEILKELDDYSIPDGDKEKFDTIRQKIAGFDYDGILELLGE